MSGYVGREEEELLVIVGTYLDESEDNLHVIPYEGGEELLFAKDEGWRRIAVNEIFEWGSLD